MDSDVIKVASEVVELVKTIYNPANDHNTRTTAHRMLDNFKDNSELCAKCGFFLTSHEDPTIRHFGLQLVDHYIKLHWNQITLPEKLWIKNNVMDSIAKGSINISGEQNFVKDAWSRVVVEIIKREWPQQWPTLLTELDELCSLGNRQTELVLLVFLRLIEDTVRLQNFSDKRRKDIRKAICSEVNKLLKFFWKTFVDNYDRFLIQKRMDPKSEQTLSSFRLANLSLDTFTEFTDVFPIDVLIREIGFDKLCILLENPEFQNKAALCLLNILEIQTSPTDKQELHSIFDEDVLFQSTASFLTSAYDSQDEQKHSFLKLLGRVFLNLIQVVVYFKQKELPLQLWEHRNFQSLVNCAFLFCKHSSIVSLEGQNMLSHLLRDSFFSTLSAVSEVIPSILKMEIEKLMMIDYLSKADSTFLKLAFEIDDEDDIHNLSTKFRMLLGDNLREITRLQPEIAFNFGKTLLDQLLSGKNWNSFVDFPGVAENPRACWKALVFFMDSVCSVLLKYLHSGDNEVLSKLSLDGIMHLKSLLNFTSNDPVITSYALSCISCLFIFPMTCDSDLCQKIIEKIFGDFAHCSNNLTEEYKELRRHTAFILIKLSSNHSKFLFPYFEYIYKRICELSGSNPECFSNGDKVAFCETIMILSNEFKDYDKQSYFLEEILGFFGSMWMSDEIQLALSSVDHFISVLGVDIPFDPKSEDQCLSKPASDIKLCTNVFYSAVKRCTYPSDPEFQPLFNAHKSETVRELIRDNQLIFLQVAKKGNFIHPLSEPSNTIYYRSPVAQFLISKLPRVFQLAKLLNSMYDPQNRHKIDPSYLPILGADTRDMNLTLGLNAPKSKNRVTKIKNYILDLSQTCIAIMGVCAENCTMDFYMIPNLKDLLYESLFCNIQHVPDTRLKLLIHGFLLQFSLNCPGTTNPDLMSILLAYFTFMLQKLTSSWNKFKLKYGNSINYEEQQTEVDEIAEDRMNRLLSKAHIDFTVDLLTKIDKQSLLHNDSMEEDAKQVNCKTSNKGLSPLGNALINAEDVRSVIICTAFNSLQWLDTMLNIKAIILCELIFKQLAEKRLIQSIQEATYLLQSVLNSIKELGQHESNLSALIVFGITIYQTLRPTFPEISQALQDSTNCDPSSLSMLNDLMNKPYPQVKQVKDAFKNVIKQIIGVNVGQQYKRNVVIKNLKSFQLPSKENISFIDSTDDIGLCNLFIPFNGN